MAVADLPGQRGEYLDLRGLGQLIPHARDRMPFEILRGILVGLKLRERRLCGRKFFLHCSTYLRRNSRRSLASMSRAVITLTNPPGNRRNTTNARRPSSVSPNAMYRFSRVLLTLWLPAKTSSTSSGVNACLSMWKMLTSSHSNPETTTVIAYQIVYTKRYDARRFKKPGAAR